MIAVWRRFRPGFMLRFRIRCMARTLKWYIISRCIMLRWSIAILVYGIMGIMWKTDWRCMIIGYRFVYICGCIDVMTCIGDGAVIYFPPTLSRRLCLLTMIWLTVPVNMRLHIMLNIMLGFR